MQKSSRFIWATAFLVAAIFVSKSESANAAEEGFVEPIVDTSFETLMVEGDPGLATEDSKAGNADCFDYYHFQSVQVTLGAGKESFIPGEKIVFSGNLVNENDYPIVGGYVFARVSRVNSNLEEGNDIIDEFFALEKVALDAKESRNAEFEWSVPSNATAGKYRVEYFFSVGKKFNLGGLPFSNEVIGGFSSFSVNSPVKASLSLDRSGTKVNGVKYNHIGNLPVIPEGGRVTVDQPLKNTFSENRKADVTYDLFYWDSLDESDRISTRSEQVSVSGDESGNLSYVIDGMNDSVYLLRITAVSGDQKSIVKIRIASDQERPRMNYPAITAFPVREKESFSLFSCFHNTSGINTEGNVVVTLLDRNGKEVGKLDYRGSIPAAMSASKEGMTAGKDYPYLKLVAKVFDKSGKEVDRYEVVYDCAELKSEKCRAMQAVQGNKMVSMAGETLSKFKTAIILAVILLVASLGLIAYKKRSGSGRGPSVTILTILTIGSLFLVAGEARAIYNERNPVVTAGYNQYWFNYCNKNGPNDDVRIASGSNLSITHSIGMTAGGTSVSTGANINFALGDSTGSFTALGGHWDTPYMTAVNNWNSALPFNIFSTPSRVHLGRNGYDNPSGNPIYITWTFVKPTSFTLSSSNNSVISCSGTTCTAVAAGSATITATIPRTTVTPWTYIYFNAENGWLFNPTGGTYGHRLCGGDDRACVGDCYVGGNVPWASLPEKTATWDVTVFGCTGTVPGHASLCSADDTGLTANTARSLVAACSAPAGSVPKCEYTCNTGYILQGGVCVVLPVCTDPQPAKATLCSGDDAGLAADTPKTLVTACSTPDGSNPKCEYVCSDPYIYQDGVCVAPPCSGQSCTDIDANSHVCGSDGTTLSPPKSWWFPSSCSVAGECRCGCNGSLTWNAAQSKCVCSIPSPYYWKAVQAPNCSPGDNCTTKYGLQECYNSCDQRVTDESLCPQPKPDAPKNTCPCTNRDNTYREVNP